MLHVRNTALRQILHALNLGMHTAHAFTYRFARYASFSIDMLLTLGTQELSDARLRELKFFLKNPYAAGAISIVDRELPSAAKLYRAQEPCYRKIAHGTLSSHLDCATDVFDAWQWRGGDIPDQAVLHLLRCQIALLEEQSQDLREELQVLQGTNELLTDAESRNILRALAFHEAIFMVLIKLYSLQVGRDHLSFSPTLAGQASIRTRTVMIQAQTFTDVAVRHELHLALRLHRRLRPNSHGPSWTCLRPQVLDLLETRLLDTYFSLSSMVLKSSSLQPHLGPAKMLCRWLAVLELARVAGESGFSPTPKALKRLGLDLRLIEKVFDDRADALKSDMGIYRNAAGEFTLGASGLGHSAGVCKDAVIDAPVAAMLGKWFEEHIREYVSETISTADYLVFPGFKKGGRDVGENYDCDLIIVEPARKKIFFIQSKWKKHSRTATLDDELDEWRSKNSALTHGVSQLRGLRNRLAEPAILEKIRTSLGKRFRMSPDEIFAGAHFVVLHTLPFFSAYENDGVILYEWNLFRNLLRKGAMRRVFHPSRTLFDTPIEQEVCRDQTLRIEDP